MTPASRPDSGSTSYQIKVKGHLPDRWSDWFDGMLGTDRRQRWQELGYVVVGTCLIWLVFDRTATWLGSLRGEAGLLVCALVVVAALLVERLLFKTGLRQAIQRLGLGYPDPRAMSVALLISLGLSAFFPLFSLVTGAQMSLRGDRLWLALGLYAQHGMAEELMFRGFLSDTCGQGAPSGERPSSPWSRSSLLTCYY